MNTWKKVLISALCVLAMGVAVTAGLLVYAYCEKKYQRGYNDMPSVRLSADIVMEYVCKRDKWYVRLKNIRTGKYTTPNLAYVFIPEPDGVDSLTVFRTPDRKRGYLNVRTGRIVVAAEYDRAWQFSEGLAAVYKDGAVSFITPTGEAAFGKTFPILYDDYHRSITPVFHEGLCVMRTLDNKWGLIDTAGEWAVEPVYNSIDAPKYGYRRVFDGKKYGLLAMDGTIALSLEYDDIRPASGNAGFVLVQDGIGWEVDVDFQTTISFVCDGIYDLGYGYYRYDLGENSGLMDAYGVIVEPAIYYYVNVIDETIIEITKTRDGEHFRKYLDGKSFIDPCLAH